MFRFRAVRNADDFDGSTYAVSDWAISYDRLGYVRQVPAGSAFPRRWEFSLSNRTRDFAEWQYSATNTRNGAAEALAVLYRGGTPQTIANPVSRPANTVARRTASAAADRGRYFGVEMELTGPNAGIIIRELTAAGIRMSAFNRSHGYEASYGHTNTNANEWTLKHDGSVHGSGLELVSPKLRGSSGLAAVRTVCEVLNRIGATVDRSTGLHVHHDMRGLTGAQVRRQCLALIERQDLFMQMVAPSRRTNTTYCPQWTAHQVDQLRAAADLATLQRIGPRGTLNMWAYGAHGTVEVRAHAGTTNAKKIIAWVRFGQAIFAAGEAGASISTTSARQMLVDLVPFGLTAEDAAWLLRFETAGQTRAEVAASVAVAESVLEEVS